MLFLHSSSSCLLTSIISAASDLVEAKRLVDAMSLMS
jgi:hypothetical protein